MKPADWFVVNDTVMGGVSSSSILEYPDGGILFTGDLSLENNGGFTSARTANLPADWSGLGGFKLRLIGDGRQYIATVRTDDPSLRRIYYRLPFNTIEGEKQTITFPFNDFQAYAYGQRIRSAPPLATLLERVGSIGIMLADKQPGSFQLAILNVSPHPALDEKSSDDQVRPTSIEQVLELAISEGVPKYNGGQPDRCADIYQTAIVSILLLASSQLNDSDRTTLNVALNGSRRSQSEEERAWILRRAMDKVLSPLSPAY